MQAGTSGTDREARNKELERGFYEDLWFSERTDRYDRYMADEYIVHDIGDRKDAIEPAVVQKEIADRFHAMGTMSGEIDCQIADGDLVATRWQWRLEDAPWWMRAMGGSFEIPIINVFRFEDDRIVEIWNHRHDIDTSIGRIPFFIGLGIGLLLALISWAVAIVIWLRHRRGGQQEEVA